jgi:hypothetical protein
MDLEWERSEWVSAWVRECVSAWVRECVSEWAKEILNRRSMKNHDEKLYIRCLEEEMKKVDEWFYTPVIPQFHHWLPLEYQTFLPRENEWWKVCCQSTHHTPSVMMHTTCHLLRIDPVFIRRLPCSVQTYRRISSSLFPSDHRTTEPPVNPYLVTQTLDLINWSQNGLSPKAKGQRYPRPFLRACLYFQ